MKVWLQLLARVVDLGCIVFGRMRGSASLVGSGWETLANHKGAAADLRESDPLALGVCESLLN